MTYIGKIFLHSKPTKILVELKKGNKAKYASILAREADCTYSHTVKILNSFKEYNLIEFEKKGRKKLIKLTSRGEELASDMEKILKYLKKLDAEGK